jgi:hypothetical protein
MIKQQKLIHNKCSEKDMPKIKSGEVVFMFGEYYDYVKRIITSHLTLNLHANVKFVFCFKTIGVKCISGHPF